MSNKQQGAALVIVMALLTGAMVVGVSGMQSTLVDERLAGNYRASAQAQMNAEQAAAAAAKNIKNNSYPKIEANDNLSELNDGREEDNKIKTKEVLKNISYSEVKGKDLLLEKNKNCTGDDVYKNECFYFPVEIDGKQYWVAFGVVKNQEDKLVSQHVVLVELKKDEGEGEGEGEGSSTVISVISGEEGIELKGSAKIVGNIITAGDVDLQGDSSVEGNVEAGDEDGVELKGSSSVSGDVITSGDVEIDGDSSVGGNVEAGDEDGVELEGSSSIGGDVTTPGDVEISDSSRVYGEVKGGKNIDYDGFVLPSGLPDVKKLYKKINKKTKSLKRSAPEVVDWGWPRGDGYFEEKGLKFFNKEDNEKNIWVKGDRFDMSHLPCLDGRATVVRTKEFDHYNGGLEVKANTVLVVDGDFTLGSGGGESLEFSGEKAALTVFVTGDVELKSALDMSDDSVVNENGQPRFVIYALGDEDDDDDGGDVDIIGGANVVAKVYAPQSEIEIKEGGTLKGAVWGEEISIKSTSLTAGGSLTSCTGGSASAGDGFWWH